MYRGDIATVPANLAGIPAVSVKVGKDENGLPVGLQIMAARGKDSELLKFAQKFSKGGRL
ncbi:MAG: Asp-tRNA(Asn)/Glu-tRNA(Gln) amidotransferase subunit GatA, partial [Lachnospiraceae bacterium]|nr:Asp-tRNA(Asn)/Glu-tRNA(Gln) amidotransferase subunit GatA [Lachnospiraceae bacterium]